ncbi:MAG: hypothetical protein M1823_002187 [Watsoniomyces obsoletus]|nr:MAG: hypothetical protein M1823_002187 [Watsoniomyces obsoletus]
MASSPGSACLWRLLRVARRVGCETPASRRCLHQSSYCAATALPTTTPGPPPRAPLPGVAEHVEQIARRRERHETLQQLSAAPSGQNSISTGLRRKFWKDVHVKEVPDGYQIYLDTRPVRTPSKTILTIPKNKPNLATATALEWDLLTTAQQALKRHFIPLTSLVSRAENIKDEELAGDGRTREEIVNTMIRYLDTDTILCWAPENDSSGSGQHDGAGADGRGGLRELQKRTARQLITFLTSRVWPGIEIHHVGESGSIIPASQPQTTRDVIRGWISGLPAYELAGLERATIAGKGLLAAARLLVEWSPVFRHSREDLDRNKLPRFGVEDAAEAASLEVRWQTDYWGEVEDTHDVDREDLRRQLGSVVLLVSGE